MRIARRRFISLLGSAAVALPRAAAAQQLPVVGFLHPALVESYAPNAAGFARGLEERGFAEAQNLAIEYRFANGHLDQLEALAADLVRRSPAVIVAGGAAAAIAAKAATATIPIVLVSGYDPARLGLIASLSHPGGNVTGVAFATAGLMSKKLGFLRELVPRRRRPSAISPKTGGPTLRARRYRARSPDLKSEMLAAAGALEVVVAEIGSDHDYGTAFETFVARRVGALVVAPSEVFANDADEIVALAERNAMPTMFERRTDVVAGGLISYGASRARGLAPRRHLCRRDSRGRQAGRYAGDAVGQARADDQLGDREIARPDDSAAPARAGGRGDRVRAAWLDSRCPARQEEQMCRNIRTLFNFEPPATDEEVRASALQFVRKLSGFTNPSKANEAAFQRAVDDVSDAARRLLESLETSRPARDRETEAMKARAKARERFA